MDPIKIEGTPKTPTVNFDAESGVLEIKGRSIPEHAVEFYKPLVDWIGSYGDSAKSDTVVNISARVFQYELFEVHPRCFQETGVCKR